MPGRAGRRRPDPAADDGWTSEVSSGLALAGFLGLVFVGFTLLAMGPLMSLDAYFNLDAPPAGWLPFLHALDRIGQRAICLPVLAVVTFVCCRHVRSWRPALLAAAAVFVLNLLVLVLKVALGRGQPAAADPSFFVGGMAYPSGHTANMVLVYGLAVYLLGHYRRIDRRVVTVLWSAVVLLSVVMVATSLTLDWHWFADLIAGLLVGGTVLQLSVAADVATGRTLFDDGPRAAWRELRSRPGRRAGRRPGRRSEPPTMLLGLAPGLQGGGSR